MKKILIYSFLSICVCSGLYAQDKVFETEKAFSQPKSSGKESFAFPNQQNGNVLLVLADKKITQGILLDENYNYLKTINAKPLPTNYTSLLGYAIFDNVYSLLFEAYNGKKYGILTMDANTNGFSLKLLDQKFKKEKFVESFTYNNQLYVFMIKKQSSDMNLYLLEGDQLKLQKTFSLKELELKSKVSQRSIPLYNQLIYRGGSLIPSGNVTKIETSNPNVIERTSESLKVYQFENRIIFTLDNQNKITRTISIDLDSYDAKTNLYSNYKDAHLYTKSNSYIFDNKLFQMASSNERMKLVISSLESNEILKKYEITRNDSITFKNSPIFQEGGGMFPQFTENRIREMEKTAKYLRKISAGDLGISVYQIDGLYNIVLGGTRHIVQNTGFAMNPGFGTPVMNVPFGNNGVFMSFNPTFGSYNSYTSTKSTYINCLFDENFDHVPGDIPLNQYDLINEFEDSLDNPTAINVFMHRGVLHYNYFDSNEKIFRLFRFE